MARAIMRSAAGTSASVNRLVRLARNVLVDR